VALQSAYEKGEYWLVRLRKYLKGTFNQVKELFNEKLRDV